MKRARIYILIIGIVAAFTTTIVTAQVQEPQDHCAISEEIFENSQRVYRCEIVDRSGEIIVIESFDGRVIERPATPREVTEYNDYLDRISCRATVQSSRTLLATPIAVIDVSELSIRLAALETIVLNECN